MDSMIKKFVDDGFMTEDVGNKIQETIDNGQSIIIAGHRSAGTRPFFASVMGAAKKENPSVQVKKDEDLEKEAKYYLVPANPDTKVFEGLLYGAMQKDGSALITLKEPEAPVSLLKLLKKMTKEGVGQDKKFLQVECRKANDIPFVDNVTEYYFEGGKVKNEEFYNHG